MGLKMVRPPSLSTLDRIRRVLVESLRLNIASTDLQYEAKLEEVAGMDSLAILEFVVALEAEFGVIIEPRLLRLKLIRDLEGLASYVEERMSLDHR